MANVTTGQYGGMANQFINAGQHAGFFDPTGSDLINKIMRGNALRGYTNTIQRGNILGRVAGLDPMQARQQFVDTSREATSGLAGTLSGVRQNQLTSAQDWTRGLFGTQLGYEHEADMAKLQEQIQKELMDYQRGGQIGPLLGQILGTAGGGFAGEVGKRAAGKLFT